MPTWLTQLERSGFAVVPAALPEFLREPLIAVFDEHRGRAGSRHALRHDAVRALAASEVVRRIAQAALGARAFAVRATLFDKTPSSNWLVAWHQDTMIPVRVMRDVTGFTAWSRKGDVPYARAPVHVLESMVAVRVDVDGTDGEAGPLRVIPGSHRRGALSSAEIHELQAMTPAIPCHVRAGGALVMRPLLLHASSKASSPRHRRVVHLEFAAADLPGGLEWYDRYAVADPSNKLMHQTGVFRLVGRRVVARMARGLARRAFLGVLLGVGSLRGTSLPSNLQHWQS